MVEPRKVTVSNICALYLIEHINMTLSQREDQKIIYQRLWESKLIGFGSGGRGSQAEVLVCPCVSKEPEVRSGTIVRRPCFGGAVMRAWRESLFSWFIVDPLGVMSPTGTWPCRKNGVYQMQTQAHSVTFEHLQCASHSAECFRVHWHKCHAF